jgi:cytochrome c-type biogenesis protein CcmH
MDGASLLAFAAAAAAMAVVAALFVLAALRARACGGDRAQLNAAAFATLAADLERERRLGLIDAAAYATARADLARRALHDTRPEAATHAAAASRAPRRAVWTVALALPVAAAALYAMFGAPGVIAAGTAEFAVGGGHMEPPALRAQLEGHLQRHPQDGRAWVLLGRLLTGTGEFERAAQAFERALAASPKVARDPGVWCEFADALGMAQGRVLQGAPRAAIERALALDPGHPRALEMAGSAAFEARDFRAAAAHWRQLLAQIPGDTPAHAQLNAALLRVERLAQFSLPSAGVSR